MIAEQSQLDVPSDPPCWGMEGCILLPTSWTDELENLSLGLASTRRTGQPPSAASLTRIGWFAEVKWTKPPVAVALEVAEALLSTGDERRLIQSAVETRVPVGSPAGNLEQLPLLQSTLMSLEKCGISVSASLGLLDEGEPVRLFRLLGRLDAFLDLLLTPAHWIDVEPTEMDPYAEWKPDSNLPTPRGVIRSALLPTDLYESVQLAQLRHIRMAGAANLYTDVSSGWPIALGTRAGISLEASDTLEHSGQLVGVTRERVRQVANRIALTHTHHRAWGIPETLEPFWGLLKCQRGEPLAAARASIHQLLPDKIAQQLTPTVAADRIISVLRAYGADLPTPVMEGQAHLFVGPELLPDGWDRARLRSLAWKTTRGTGLGRLDDLRVAVRSEDPSLTEAAARQIIEVGIADITLPLGYFVQDSGQRLPVFATTAARMVEALGALHIEDVRHGLQRRYTFRQLGLVPPSEVLTAALESYPMFSIDGQIVRSQTRSLPPPATISGWIFSQLSEAPYGTIHRLVLLDRARATGLNPSSVSIYMTFGEYFTSAGEGSGCVMLIGSAVSPDGIESARLEASLLRIPTDIRVENEEWGLRLRVGVGTDLFSSGVISMPRTAKLRVGKRRLTVLAAGEKRGTMAMSGGLLYGLLGGLNAIGAGIGDAVVVNLRLVDGTAIFNMDNSDSYEADG